MIGRALLLTAAGVMLAGCQTTGVGSVKGGECRIFERPDYAVRGLRRYDQDWIDSQIEGGVGGCGWARPKPRPAALDGGAPRAAIARPAPRRSLIRRIRDRVAPKPAEPAAAPAPIGASPPPAPPRDAVDDLLDSSQVR